MTINGVNLCGASLAEAFNNYFVNIATSSTSISQTPYATSTDINYSLRESMLFFPTTDSEIISTFRSLKNTGLQEYNVFQLNL